MNFFIWWVKNVWPSWYECKTDASLEHPGLMTEKWHEKIELLAFFLWNFIEKNWDECDKHFRCILDTTWSHSSVRSMACLLGSRLEGHQDQASLNNKNAMKGFRWILRYTQSNSKSQEVCVTLEGLAKSSRQMELAKIEEKRDEGRQKKELELLQYQKTKAKELETGKASG
jgi:hypothetical protein